MLTKGVDVLRPAIVRGDVKIISDQFAREWRADEALRITEDALTKTGKNIQAIVASNDGTAGRMTARPAARCPHWKQRTLSEKSSSPGRTRRKMPCSGSCGESRR
jgi:hypothetical protein